MEKTICFTGHRPNKMAGYKHENYCCFLNSLEEHLQKYLDAGFTKFITGGAQGADQLAFWAVHRLKLHNPSIPIQNIAYIPFCLITTGGATVDIIKQYIQSQGKKYGK